MIKKIIFFILITISFANIAYAWHGKDKPKGTEAQVDTSECDKIKGILKQGEKIDCLLALKGSVFINKDKPKLKFITDKINSLKTKKQNYDNRNKTLKDMFKNLPK